MRKWVLQFEYHLHVINYGNNLDIIYSISLLLLDVTHETVIPNINGKIETPVLHCHGKEDIMLSYNKAKMTSKLLSSLVQEYRFHLVPKMGHEPNEEEMDLLKQFIHEKLQPM